MRPLGWPLLADENIHPDVVRGLAARGMNIRSILENGAGLSDREVLGVAHREQRVVLTHDADFGRLVTLDGEPFTGIVYLRPGHFSAEFVLAIVDALESAEVDVEPPFLVVAERRGLNVRIRLRTAPRTE